MEEDVKDLIFLSFRHFIALFSITIRQTNSPDTIMNLFKVSKFKFTMSFPFNLSKKIFVYLQLQIHENHFKYRKFAIAQNRDFSNCEFFQL